MDTTKIEIINKTAELFTDRLGNNDGLPDWQIALLSTSIGTFLAFISQYIFYFIDNSKYKKEKIVTALSEAERVGFLIHEMCKEINRYKVHKNYYQRLSELFDKEDNKKESDKYQVKHSEANKSMFSAISEVNELKGEYLKNVAIFGKFVGKNQTISKNVLEFIQYVQPKSIHFDEFEKKEIYSKASAEEARLNEELNIFYQYIQKINFEMAK